MGLFNTFRKKTIRIKPEEFNDVEKQYIYGMCLFHAVKIIDRNSNDGNKNRFESIKHEIDRTGAYAYKNLSKEKWDKLSNEMNEKIKNEGFHDNEFFSTFLSSSISDEQKNKFIKTLIIYSKSDGIFDRGEISVILKFQQICYPEKKIDELRKSITTLIHDLSKTEGKFNFDYNEFNELQRKSIIGLLICFAGVDELDDEGKESDLLDEILDFFQVNQSEMDTLPEFDEVIINLKGLTIKQKNILKYLIDLIIRADGEISTDEIALTNYFNEEIILENDLDSDKVDPKITDIKSYEKWLNTEITNEEITGNIYDVLKLLKSNEFFKKEVTNMEIIYDELKTGKLSNEDQVTKRMIEIYSKEINETPMSIETSTKLKTSSDKYLQIENILGTLLNTMEEFGDTDSEEYSDSQQYHTTTTFFYKILNEKSLEGAMISIISDGKNLKESDKNVTEKTDEFIDNSSEFLEIALKKVKLYYDQKKDLAQAINDAYNYLEGPTSLDENLKQIIPNYEEVERADSKHPDLPSFIDFVRIIEKNLKQIIPNYEEEKKSEYYEGKKSEEKNVTDDDYDRLLDEQETFEICLDCFTSNDSSSKYCSDCGKKL